MQLFLSSTQHGPDTPSNNPPEPQSQPSQTQPAQEQTRAVYPWSKHRLILPHPVLHLEPGVAPHGEPPPSPFPRHGHALSMTATATGDLWLFGGLVNGIAQNDLYMISTRNMAATLVGTRGDTPSPRLCHASALLGNIFIVWGGDTSSNQEPQQTGVYDVGLYILNLGKDIIHYYAGKVVTGA